MPPLEFILGDSLTELKRFEDDSIDALVTDPPAGISFMGKAWDTKDVFQSQMRAIFEECFRVLKPGAHGFVWALPRISHHTATALENAGFEIRDVVTHVFGTGFPKSHNVGNGWGSALKPASEHWILIRKPLEKNLSIAQNVLKYGTGAINIEASRIGTQKRVPGSPKKVDASKHTVSLPGTPNGSGHDPNIGRFPSNFIHDGIEEEWSPYFYCAKPSTSERNAGLEEFEETSPETRDATGAGLWTEIGIHPQKNCHPTVKSTKLMCYLITMICPPGGKVLDPFAGSCSTGVAAIETKREFIGIEREAEYHEIGEARLKEARGENDPQHRLFN